MKRQEVILAGAGGHALSLEEFAGEKIFGYLALNENPDSEMKWLGTDDRLQEFIREGHTFHIAYVYKGLPRMDGRARLIRKYEDAGARFETLISPSSIVTKNSKIGEGCAVMAGAIVNRATLGRHVIINSGGIVEHDCMIGCNTFIGPGAVIGGFTTIGENCFIGLGARISNGIKIGDNVTVAMGAIVTHDLLEPGIYHGPNLKLFKLPTK
ncbi:MAG: transferase [Muribaculaceae bacterium]|nr:transferase [Muribaculaceae bacterium]